MSDLPRVRHNAAAVRTLEAALRSANVHSRVLTDTTTGRGKGFYASEALAMLALAATTTPGVVLVHNAFHPSTCMRSEVSGGVS